MTTTNTTPNDSKIETLAGRIEKAVLKNFAKTGQGGISAVMIDELFEAGKINQRESRILQSMFCGD